MASCWRSFHNSSSLRYDVISSHWAVNVTNDFITYPTELPFNRSASWFCLKCYAHLDLNTATKLYFKISNVVENHDKFLPIQDAIKVRLSFSCHSIPNLSLEMPSSLSFIYMSWLYLISDRRLASGINGDKVMYQREKEENLKESELSFQ